MTHVAGTGPTHTHGTEKGTAPLSRRTLFAFALPAAPISAMGLPLVVHLPPSDAQSSGMGAD